MATSVNASKTGIPSGASAPLTLAAGTTTVSAPVIDGSQTWNDAAVTFTGYKLNVTDTASAAASMLADFQIGGVSKFSVDKTGRPIMNGGQDAMKFTTAHSKITLAAALYLTANAGSSDFVGFVPGLVGGLRVLAGNLYGWTADTTNVGTTADTAFGRKQAKIPEVNDGTAGSYVGTALLLGPMTVAQLPAAAAGLKGARATVSDASAPTFLGALTGGGAVACPVFCNGAAWVAG